MDEPAPATTRTDGDARLIDADNHYYEPRDCFTRYLDPAYRDRGVRVELDERGRDVVMIGDRQFTFLDDPFGDVKVKPGALRELLRTMGSGRVSESEAVEVVRPEYVDREARLARMDAQGLEAIVVFPTFGVCVEHFLKDDPDLLDASFRAFNRWLNDDWGYAHEGRIFAAPMLSLRDVDAAVVELERVLAEGARVVGLRPGPAYGRSPADPHFDAFWARVNEAGVLVAFHIGESGYNEMMAPFWGEDPNPSSHHQSAFQWTNCYGDRPIMDTCSALVLHNLFGRFPNVRCLSVENGSLWVAYLLKVMNKMNGMGRNGPWLGGRLTERPSDVFKRHVYVSPYHEEDIVALTEVLGTDRVVFGSDYPHPEGLAEPADFAAALTPLDPPARRRILHDNIAAVLSSADSGAASR
jgi:predicted TIM-barrel fold metal-dependent hydrolase